MAPQPDEVVEISIADLTPEQIQHIADVVACHTNKEFLQHQREVLKIKCAAFLTAVPFALLCVCALVSTVTSLVGHQWQPLDWLINLLTALTTAAISQMAATLMTARQKSLETKDQEEDKSTIILPRRKIEAQPETSDVD